MATHSQLQPHLGFGLGLRSEHYTDLIEHDHNVDWLEILSENYMVAGGKPLHYLDQICERYPVVMHGVSLSIGSVDPLNNNYLAELKKLAQRVKPKWISDHLCWTGTQGINLHDLMPLPYTEEALKHLVARITQVQEFLGQRILLENVSSYLTFQHSTISEWEFLSALAKEADCLILLDINNIHVSAHNHNFDPLTYLDAIPAERIQQIHLAGHLNKGDYSIDTHDHEIIDSVWELYAESVRRFGHISTMIERDDDIPPLNTLLKELEKARSIYADVLSENNHHQHIC
ncbi:UPF0276 protein [Cellvibrio zantedeschiae]|uniref:UPF0276 protein GCM10011613_06870 n=1 Tax=Cellvibrio zantedeschiae TaxID=1237077 RepID=A0ABQ3AV88_9GAMM|nr:DUF692 domain-containing protein [Cellvibrio zantedeschiae]GGY65618.1 UPF0276 protein [Cellvibrio zantedeschiae]